MSAHGPLRPPGSGRGTPARVPPARRAAPTTAPLGALDSWRSRRRLRTVAAALLLVLAAALFVRERLDTTTVHVTAADLDEGHSLSSADVREVEVPASVAPPAALHSWPEVDGRVLVSAMGEGEILTASRVDAPTDSDSDAVRTVSVPVPDKGTLALLHPGATVDVFSATSTTDAASNQLLAAGAKVKEVPHDSHGEMAGTVAIQVPTAVAPAVAAAAVEGPVILIVAG